MKPPQARQAGLMNSRQHVELSSGHHMQHVEAVGAYAPQTIIMWGNSSLPTA